MRRDTQAARVVPPSGVTARLTVFVAAIMAYLAVFALALSLSAGRLADRWSDELAQTATLRITAPMEERTAQTRAALQILRQTPGVAEARALTQDEQAALLAPWFGPDPVLEGLPMPQLIELRAGTPPYDPAGLRARLAGEFPGAVLDDHSRWQAPLVRAADGLRLMALVSIALIVAAMAAMITLAANASLASNAQVIDVLRLVGARDGFIAQGFVRRFTWRGFTGALIGTGLAVASVVALPDMAEDGLLTGLAFEGGGWLLPLLVPLVVAMIAFVATLGAAQRRLRGAL